MVSRSRKRLGAGKMPAMNEQNVPLVGGPLQFAGAVSLDANEQGVQPWRLRFREMELYEPPLRQLASVASGVRMTLVSNTRNMTVEIADQDPYKGRHDWTLDLLVDGKLHQRITRPRQEAVYPFTGIPAGEHRLEVYLFQAGPMRIKRVAIDAKASAKPFHDERPKWIAYGSSLTHCAGAHGPSQTWPALVANRFDLNLTCLGYGSNCQLEPVMAMMIRDLPADLMTLCVGINIWGKGSMDLRTYRAAVIGLVKIIREKHPTTPIALISTHPCFSSAEKVNKAEMTPLQMIEQTWHAFDALRSYGDDNLFFVDGTDLIGALPLGPLMPEDVHPSADGYVALADLISERVMPKIISTVGAAGIAG